MWSIARLLLYCAKYSISCNPGSFFVTERNTASDSLYSEKVGVNFFGDTLSRLSLFLLDQLSVQ